ncbi:MAG: ATP-binding protein [Candidatus Binatia bacterium]
MKLLEMEIENFRQFYGEQSIEFGSSDSKKNITVFHGYNGSGKTALLNAFIWCLYGETTSDLEAPDKLENERAAAEASIGAEMCVSVALRFEYHDEVYRVQRSRKSVKDGANSFRPGEADWICGGRRFWRTGDDRYE